MSLSHQDVQDILRLLDDTDYTELTLETDNFTLILNRSDDDQGWVQETTVPGHKSQGYFDGHQACNSDLSGSMSKNI